MDHISYISVYASTGLALQKFVRFANSSKPNMQHASRGLDGFDLCWRTADPGNAVVLLSWLCVLPERRRGGRFGDIARPIRCHCYLRPLPSLPSGQGHDRVSLILRVVSYRPTARSNMRWLAAWRRGGAGRGRRSQHRERTLPQPQLLCREDPLVFLLPELILDLGLDPCDQWLKLDPGWVWAGGEQRRLAGWMGTRIVREIDGTERESTCVACGSVI